MRSREELLEVLHRVCTDVSEEAMNASEVSERLIAVTSETSSVAHREGLDIYEGGGVVAFVNNSGVPFVEQSEQLVARVAALKPEAVLLGGSALIGRPGGSFKRVLAVQLFSTRLGIRTARIADVPPSQGAIESVGAWRETQAGPPVWAEEALAGK